MNKKEFMSKCKEALEEGWGISVLVDLPGNKELERISNHNTDIENKMAYYDKTYNENMEHKFSPVPVKITNVEFMLSCK